MTTHSIAEIGRGAIRIVKEKRPDIRVRSITGRRAGPWRLARITLETGEFLQAPLLALGTGTRALEEALAKDIMGMVRAPISSQVCQTLNK